MEAKYDGDTARLVHKEKAKVSRSFPGPGPGVPAPLVRAVDWESMGPAGVGIM